MKRRTGFALMASTLAALLLLSACGSGSSPGDGGSGSGKKLVIGDVLFDTDAYQIAQQKQMQKYADSLGIKIIFENQQGQGTKAPDLMQALQTRGVDGIIMQPANANVAVPLVRQAQAQKVPVLGWAIPFGAGVTAPYVGLEEKAETEAAGKAAAQYVQKNFPGQPVKVLIVTITGVSSCSDDRMGPFEQGVKSVAPNAQITTVNGGADRNTAVTVAQDALQRDKGYNIATGCNSDMAMGALQAFKSAGLGGATNKKPDHTYFYSINGTDEELRALTDPTSPLMADLGLTPKEVAKTLIDTMEQMISGKIPAYSNHTVNVPDKPLGPDCTAANDFNKSEYFATTNLPCVGN
ncbi:sugar ABC transporter substrate-binding protein [Actinacidiphila oryziradicis]|uniref:Sugar ABC transporter substrate-binding protein n=1 Tax=Actinacidiphila oryziradicis TaxID=2571141 RepID=A0A4U0SMJ7_9ACTN|nr:sugar ABC transporter substrate-binding protein [Actinacidiphila oryziradicis]TKA10916.1 sugar ABC transporter substrate-binding protein [Actinacidiphila oryziradicis]